MTTEIESLRQANSELDMENRHLLEEIEVLRAENEALRGQYSSGREAKKHCLKQLAAEQLKSKALREALEHIEEYWNGDANDQAMFDALYHIEDTATKALNNTPASTASPQEAREHLEDYFKQRLGEPVAWVFQHEETGRVTFVDTQQVEWGFEKNNPRWIKVEPLYRLA